MQKFRKDAKPVDLAVAFQLHWVHGQSMRAVAVQFGLDHANLMMRFRRFGIPIRPQRLAATGPIPRYGPDNHMWKGGVHTDKRGYVHVRVNGKNRYLHRIMGEKVLGRPLKQSEVVHHFDGNRGHNENSNFVICTQAYHSWLEAKLQGFRIGVNHKETI